MVSLGMIDTMGFGIRTTTLSQRNRFFPLPDYSKSELNKVVLNGGHVIDENYTRLLLEREDLPLNTVMLLDRVQKKQLITDAAAAMLRKQGLIEGRKPNYYTAAWAAQSTGKAITFAIEPSTMAIGKTPILDYSAHYGSASRDELVTLILDKLSTFLDEKQKQNKFRNLLNAMSTASDKTIEKSGGLHKGRWVLSS